MKIKNSELMILLKGLYAVKNVRNRKIMHNMSRNKKMLENELKEYQDAVTELQKEHCELDEDGNLVTVEKDGEKGRVVFLSKEHEKMMNKELAELNESEGDIPIRTITFEDLESDTGDIRPEEVDYLLFMIEE